MYEYIDKWDYKPAISVSVLGKNTSFDFADGYSSISAKTKNTETTPHIFFSITKSFTAASVLKLEHEGLLSLSDRLDKYITGLNTIYVNNDATISELLIHKSGIADYASNAELFYQNPFSAGGTWDPVKILDFVEIPATDRGIFTYSSANYIILGMIVEKVSGKLLNRYISENFLVPLGLADLKILPQDSIDYSVLSHPHAYPGTSIAPEGDGKTPIDLTDIISNANELLAKCGWAAGGMVGTSDKAAKWGYDLLSSNGAAPSFIRDEIKSSVSSFTDETPADSAYGIAVRKLYHNGKEFIGSYGRSIGDENLMFYNPDKDVCITILTSSNTKKDGSPNIDELMYAIYEAL